MLNLDARYDVNDVMLAVFLEVYLQSLVYSMGF